MIHNISFAMNYGNSFIKYQKKKIESIKNKLKKQEAT